MKPGRLTCAGLVVIMMVLPNTLWKGGSSQAKVQVVVRVADAGLNKDEGRDATHRQPEVARDQSRSLQTRVLGLSR